VALLLMINLDGEGDSGVFKGIVGCMSIVPIGLPIFIKLYVRFFGGLEVRAVTVHDSVCMWRREHTFDPGTRVSAAPRLAGARDAQER